MWGSEDQRGRGSSSASNLPHDFGRAAIPSEFPVSPLKNTQGREEVTPGVTCYLRSDNVKTFVLFHIQTFTQECLKHLATKKQQQVDNITQIEDAAEKLKASGGFFLILVEMSTSLLQHRVLPSMEPGKMKTNLKEGLGGAWSFCSLGDPFEEKEHKISCKTMKGSF